MNNTTTVDLSKLVTPIQAATRLGKAPQYIYQLLRSGKVPAEHLVALPKGDGTMREVLQESFFTWFESRATGRIGTAAAKNPVVTYQMTADEMMIAMAARLEASGNKKFLGLADALKSAVVSILPEPAAPSADVETAATHG